MIKLSFNFSINLFGKEHKDDTKTEITTGKEHFAKMAAKVIEAQMAAHAKSTVDNYRTALRSFTKYTGTNITVDAINVQLLEGYQQWLQGQGVALNTISCYMRSLRALIHFASPETNTHRLFGKVFTGKAKTDKRSITVDEANKLRLLRLPSDSMLAFSRDIFMFSFYALGMPFVDIAFLRKSQIADGYIVYNRHKTGQRIRVKVEPLMQQIIERYHHNASPYVFPILTTIDTERAITEYETARSRYNRHLKQLGARTGIQHILTSYVARHSWASMAYHSNVDLSVISKALGHTSPNTTLTYIREIDDSRVDDANCQLMDKFGK